MVKASRTGKTARRAKPASTKANHLGIDAALASKRDLQRRIRVERDIVKLTEQLKRRMRSSDQRLLDLGTVFIERAARMLQGDAARDADIAAAKQRRETVPPQDV